MNNDSSAFIEVTGRYATPGPSPRWPSPLQAGGGTPARRSMRRGHVQRGVAVEEARRLEPERDRVRGHDRPVLRPGDVVDAEHVPQDHVGPGDRPVLPGPGGQALVPLAL